MSPRSVSSAPITLVRLDSASRTPLHRQIYLDLRDAIVTGRLIRGAQLPAARLLAHELLVSRQTVSMALDQLRAEGYVEMRERSGTFVSHALPDELLGLKPARSRTLQHAPKQATHIAQQIRERTPLPVSINRRVGRGGADWARSTRGIPPRPFRIGLPALDAFPWRIWARLVGRHLRSAGQTLADSGDPRGYSPLRTAIAAYVSAARGVECTPDQVVITHGARQGLELVTQVLVAPGTAVWIEDPSYLGARHAFVAAGARLVPICVDEAGLSVVDGMQRAPHARVVYVTPSHQYPLGVTMTAARRLELLQWARSSAAWVIEDDYDSEFRYASRPLASLQGLDNSGRVVYVGTFSKTLFPSLRIGYLVVPTSLVDAFAAVRFKVDYPGPSNEAALTDFINDGHFARHIRHMRLLYQERRDALLQAVQETASSVLGLGPSDAGMHVVGWLPRHISDRDIASRCAEVGLEVAPLSPYALRRSPRAGFLLGFAAFHPRALREAMRTLASLIGLVR